MNITKRIKQIPSQLRSLNKATGDCVIFETCDFEITLREVIASFCIIAIMLIFGVMIAGNINSSIADENRKYNQALQVTDSDMFQYGMDTNVGNAFVYGDIKPVDTVSFDRIEGEWLEITETEEHYEEHTRTVTTTDSKGHTHTRTETYWSWDTYDTNEKQCENIIFCGIEFPYEKFRCIDSEYIDTVDGGYHVRFVYHGVALEHTGTIYTKLKDGTISDKTKFYDDKTIEETLNDKVNSAKAGLIVFWLIWIILTGGVTFGFYYIDNAWLE